MKPADIFKEVCYSRDDWEEFMNDKQIFTRYQADCPSVSSKSDFLVGAYYYAKAKGILPLSYSGVKTSAYQPYVDSGFISKQMCENLVFLHNPSQTCRHCNKHVSKEDFDIAIGYWTPHCWFPVHKQCKKAQKENEAYECQKIDASCNDCGFYDRVADKCTNPNTDFQLKPLVNTYVGAPCFVHRKDLNK